eukprot:3422404-Rhodomonas_salina.1
MAADTEKTRTMAGDGGVLTSMLQQALAKEKVLYPRSVPRLSSLSLVLQQNVVVLSRPTSWLSVAGIAGTGQRDSIGVDGVPDGQDWGLESPATQDRAQRASTMEAGDQEARRREDVKVEGQGSWR